MTSLVIFDSGSPSLAPLTDLRPAFDVRTGVLTTRERLERVWRMKAAALWVPARIVDFAAERAGACGADIAINRLPPSTGDDIILLNGRWLAADAVHLDRNTALLSSGGDLLAGRFDASQAERCLESNDLPHSARVRIVEDPPLLRRPWDVIRHRDELIRFDLHTIRVADAGVLPDAVMTVGDHPIEVHRTAMIFPGVILDSTHGAIMIDERATIRPGAILCGPCAVGPGSVVVERAHIRANTVIGPVCKVGGEVGGTIFQAYSNKAHEGHLGDSWVGEWVNFGAGTTNSNLLNTYEEVSMRGSPDGPRERTGLTFLGAIVGDHAKFAILTRLMTGTLVGTGAMIARTAPPPASVPAFAWMTDEATRTYRMNKFIDVARTVMARRGVELTDTYAAAIRALASPE